MACALTIEEFKRSMNKARVDAIELARLGKMSKLNYSKYTSDIIYKALDNTLDEAQRVSVFNSLIEPMMENTPSYFENMSKKEFKLRERVFDDMKAIGLIDQNAKFEDTPEVRVLLQNAYVKNYVNTRIKSLVRVETSNNRIFNSPSSYTIKQNKHLAMYEIFSAIKSEDDILTKNNASSVARGEIIDPSTGMANIPVSKLAGNIGRKVTLAQGYAFRGNNASSFYHSIGLQLLQDLQKDGLLSIGHGKYLSNRFIQEDGSLITSKDNLIDGMVVTLNSTIDGVDSFVNSIISNNTHKDTSKELMEIMDIGKYTHRLAIPQGMREIATSPKESVNTTEYDIKVSMETENKARLYQETPMYVDSIFHPILELLRDKFNNAITSGKSMEDAVSNLANVATLEDLLGINNILTSKAGFEESERGKQESKLGAIVNYLSSEIDFKAPTYSKWKWTVNSRLHDVTGTLNKQTDKFFSRAVSTTGEYTIKVDSKGYEHFLLALEDDIGSDPLKMLNNANTKKHLEAFEKYFLNGTKEESFQFVKALLDNKRYSKTISKDKKHMLPLWNNSSIWSYLSTLNALYSLSNANGKSKFKTTYMTSPDAVTSGIVIALMQSIDKYNGNIKQAFDDLGITNGEIGVLQDFYALLTDKMKSSTTDSENSDLVSEQDLEDYSEIKAMIDSGIFNMRDLSKFATMPVAYSQGRFGAISTIAGDIIEELFSLAVPNLLGRPNNPNKKVDAKKLNYLYDTVITSMGIISTRGNLSPDELTIRDKYLDILNSAKTDIDKQNALHAILVNGDSFFNKRHLRSAMHKHYSVNVSSIMYNIIEDVLITPLLQDYKDDVGEIYDKILSISGIVKVLPPQVALELESLQLESDEELAHNIEVEYELELHDYEARISEGMDMTNVRKPVKRVFVPYNTRLLNKYGIKLTKKKEVLTEKEIGDETVQVMESKTVPNKPSVYVNIQHMLDNYTLLEAAKLTQDALGKVQFKAYPIHDANNADANTNTIFSENYSKALIATNYRYDALEQLIFSLGVAIDSARYRGETIDPTIENFFEDKRADIHLKKLAKQKALSNIKYTDNRMLFGYKDTSKPVTKDTININDKNEKVEEPNNKKNKKENKKESSKENKKESTKESTKKSKKENKSSELVLYTNRPEKLTKESDTWLTSLIDDFTEPNGKFYNKDNSPTIEYSRDLAFDILFTEKDDLAYSYYVPKTDTIVLPDFDALGKEIRTDKAMQKAIAKEEFTNSTFKLLLNSHKNSQLYKEAILHEYIHAYTYQWLNDNDNKSSKTYKDLENTFNYLKKNIKHTTDDNWSTSLHEFLAESLANDKFRAKIHAIKKIDGRTIMAKILNVFRAIFGINESNNGGTILQYIKHTLETEVYNYNRTNSKSDETLNMPFNKRGTKAQATATLLDDSWVKYSPKSPSPFFKMIDNSVFNTNEYARNVLKMAMYGNKSDKDALTVQKSLKLINKILKKNSKYYKILAERMTTLYVDYPTITTFIHTIGFDNFKQQYEKDKLHSILYNAKKSKEQAIYEVSKHIKDLMVDMSESEINTVNEYMRMNSFKQFSKETGPINNSLLLSLEDYLYTGNVSKSLTTMNMSKNLATLGKLYNDYAKFNKNFIAQHAELFKTIDLYTSSRTMLYSKSYSDEALNNNILLHLTKTELKKPKEFKVITNYDMHSQDLKQQGWEMLRPATGTSLGIVYRTYNTNGQQGILETHNKEDGISIPNYINDLNLIYNSNTIRGRIILTNEEKAKIGGVADGVDTFARSVGNAVYEDEVQAIKSFLTAKGISTTISLKTDINELEKQIKLGGNYSWVIEVGSQYKFNELPKKIQSAYRALTATQAEELGVSTGRGYVRNDIAHWVVGETSINPFNNSNKLSRNIYDVIRKAVQWKKIRLVAQNPIKLLGDLVSNYELLLSSGMTLKDIFVGSINAYRAVGELQDLARKDLINKLNGKNTNLVAEHKYGFMYKDGLIQSASMVTIADSKETATGLQTSIDIVLDKLMLLDDNSKNLFGKIVDKSAKFAIAPEYLLHYLAVGNKVISNTQLSKGIQKLSDDFKSIRTEQDGKAFLNQLLGSPNSAVTKAGTSALVMTDAVPRAVMYMHYRDNNKGGRKSHNEAIKLTNQAFIDYRVPLPKEIQFIADTGLIMFPAFLLRVQKSIYNLTVKKPITVLSIAIIEQLLDIDLVNIQENNIINRDLENTVLNPDIYGAFELDNLYPSKVF